MKCINWFLLFIAFIKLPQSLCLPSIQLHFSPLIHFDQVAFSLAVRLRSIAFTLNLCKMWVCSCVYIVKFNTISNKRNTNTCIGHIFCLQPISLTLSVLPSLAFSMYAHTYTHAHTQECPCQFNAISHWAQNSTVCFTGNELYIRVSENGRHICTILCIHSIHPSTYRWLSLPYWSDTSANPEKFTENANKSSILIVWCTRIAFQCFVICCIYSETQTPT